jgi:hypothetical protein
MTDRPVCSSSLKSTLGAVGRKRDHVGSSGDGATPSAPSSAIAKGDAAPKTRCTGAGADREASRVNQLLIFGRFIKLSPMGNNSGSLTAC